VSASVERVGDVTQIFLSTRRSRSVGYGVFLFLYREILIDTGFRTVQREVGDVLDQMSPRGVVLTHHHEDHAGNLDLVASRGLPIAAAADTIEACEAAARPGAYRRYVWGTPRMRRDPIVPFEVAPFALVPLRGHSPDHHALWDADRRALFSGDLFLGPHVRVARPGENPRELLRSVRAARDLEPRTMFDAHRGWIQDPVTALESKASWMEDTIASIDQRIDDGWSDHRITREVLGRENLTAVYSLGDLSRRNFVRAVRASRTPPG
jgi:glyoxylase-like metal-dependent hydrolase (beta-lactamase superfamily II)